MTGMSKVAPTNGVKKTYRDHTACAVVASLALAVASRASGFALQATAQALLVRLPVVDPRPPSKFLGRLALKFSAAREIFIEVLVVTFISGGVKWNGCIN